MESSTPTRGVAFQLSLTLANECFLIKSDFLILPRGFLTSPSDSFAYPFLLQKNSKRNLIPSYPFFLTIAFNKVKMPYGDSFYRKLTTRDSSDFKGRQTFLRLEACNINMYLGPPERLSKNTNRPNVIEVI